MTYHFNMNKETITTQADITVRLFVAIAKTLDEEYTRFIGTFKHEKKKAFNNLITDIAAFQSTVKVNMTSENIANCEVLQDYLHNLIADLITKDTVKDIHIFNALCKSLKTIYYKYVNDYFKHSDKDKFIQLINSADLFTKLTEQNESVNSDFEHFCITLIEQKEFNRVENQ